MAYAKNLKQAGSFLRAPVQRYREPAVMAKTAKRAATKSKEPKNTKGFEETLWDTANKLRGTVESSEYKHVVLSLILLKFSSDKFEARKQELKRDVKSSILDA